MFLGVDGTAGRGAAGEGARRPFPSEYRVVTIACPDCGRLAELPALAPGGKAACSLCDATLERTSGRSVAAGLSCALGTFFLLFPANLLPLLSVSIFGMRKEALLGSGVLMLWGNDWMLLAALARHLGDARRLSARLRRRILSFDQCEPDARASARGGLLLHRGGAIGDAVARGHRSAHRVARHRSGGGGTGNRPPHFVHN